MDKLKTTNVGGFPLVLDDLRWFFGRLGAPNDGIYQAFNNILRGYGDDFIVQGCIEGGAPGAITLTEGWVMLGGELIKVDAQAAFDEATENTFVKATTFDSRGLKAFQNGSSDDTYEKNRASISGSGGSLAFNGIRFAEMNVAETLNASSVSGTVVIKKKIIEIGDWNMDTDATRLIVHGITASIDKFKSVQVTIIADNGLSSIPLTFNSAAGVAQGSIGSIEGIVLKSITLSRTTGGTFDTTNYNATSFNRGFITIEYEV